MTRESKERIEERAGRERLYADRREEDRVGLLKNSRRKKKRKTFFSGSD